MCPDALRSNLSPFAMVVGPTECGTIKGAVDNAKLGNLTAMLENIRRSLKKLNFKGVPSSKDKELVQKLADQNTKDAVEKIMDKSPVINKLVALGKVKGVAATPDIGTGKITWFA